jgi:hypothetical protein
MTQVVTQLIVDASGAKSGVADFEAAMARAKQAAIDGGGVTATSFEAAQKRWTASLAATDPVIKAQIAQQQAMAKQEAINTQAVKLGIVSQDAAASQLDKVKQKYQEHVDAATKATTAQTLLSKATSGVSGQLIALSAGAGPVGTFLSALGPWGVAASVGLGAAENAFNLVSGAAHDLALKATELEHFSEATGLTTDQVQALTNESSKFGLTAQEVQSAVQNFTSRFNELRLGQGDLLTQIQKINPALAAQMAGATSAAQAMTIFGQALTNVDNIFQRNALLKAATGRGGAAVGQLFQGIDVNQLTQSFQQSNPALTDGLIKQLHDLDTQIDDTSKRAHDNFASIFAADVLTGELKFAQAFERVSKIALDFKLSGDWATFMNDIASSSFAKWAERVAAGSAMTIPLVGPMISAGLIAASNRQPQYSGGLQPGSANNGATPAGAANAGGLIGPPAPPALTPEFQAAQLTKLVSVLGPAATFTEQYNAKLADLKIKAHDAGVSQDEVTRAIAGLDAQTAAQQTQALASAMGSAAPIALQVLAATQRLHVEQLKDPQITNAIIAASAEQTRQRLLGTNALQQQIDTTNIAIATQGMSIAAATQYTAVQERIAQAARDGQVLTQAQIDEYTKYAATLGQVKQAQAELDAQRKASFDLQTVFMDDTEKSIAQVQQQLHGDDWQAFMNDGLAATMRLSSAMKDLKGYVNDFGQTLIQNLAQGKSLSDSLSASINNLGSQIASKAMSSAVNGLFGSATGTGSSGGFDVTNMVSQFKAMASALTSSISSAMSGVTQSISSAVSDSAKGMGDASSSAASGGGGSFGIIGNFAAALGISALQNQAAQLKQAQADFAAAQKTWSDMAGDVKKFTDQMEGNQGGTFTQSLSDATAQAQKFADAAHAAGQSADDIQKALTDFADKAARDFIGSFDVMVEALDQGLGSDSPAVKAAANVKAVGDSLQAFITDTHNVIQLTQGGATQSAQSIGGFFGAILDQVGLKQPAAAAGPIDTTPITVAEQAAQNYAVSLLQTVPPLTDVQTKLLTLRGTAQQLQSTLQDLGMSSTAAAAAISTGIDQALNQITSDFRSGLTAKINAAGGKGYLNDISSLITESLGDLSDAQSLGTDPTIVAQYFQAQAQAIVDGAGLVGDSFGDLIKQFPSLAGVVHQSTTALDQLTSSVGDFLASLAQGDLSTLSPQQKLQAAQSTYQSTLTAAQGGDSTALGSITNAAQSFLTAAQAYFASSPDYGAIYAQVTGDLGRLPGLVSAIGTTNQLLGSVAVTSGASRDQLAAANDNLSDVGQNTDATASATDSAAQTLVVLQGLQATTKTASIDISASITQLGAQSQAISTTQSSQYFQPMVDYLAQIAQNTQLTGTPAAPPQDSFEWWNPFTWFAEGGPVTGGTPGKDSVLGMLMPGEFVMNARVSQMYRPMLEAMNSGKLPSYIPHFADGGVVGSVPTFSPTIVVSPFAGMAIGSSSSSNDNYRQNFADLARSVAAGHQAIVAALHQEIAGLRAEVRALNDTTRITAGRPGRPGGKPASQKAA